MLVLIPLSSPSHYYLSTDRSNDRESESESEREETGSVRQGWIQGEKSSLKAAMRGLSWVKHLLHMFGPSPCWRYARLPSLAVSVCVRVCCPVPACATVPKYICFSASCQSEAILFCTPTVACGTVIFVDATPVTFRKSPERSGPNKHRHGWFCLFCTLFSGHSSWNPDPEAVFRHYQIRNESRANL